MLRATTESAVRATLVTAAETGTAVVAHTAHVATLPVRAATNAAVAVGIGLATTLIVGAIEYAAYGLWWVGSSVTSLAWSGTKAAGSVAYNSLFGAPQPKMITWHDSYDILYLPTSKSVDDSSKLLENTPPPSPKKPSVGDID